MHAAIGGVSINRKGWLFAWIAYVAATSDAPELSVWPAAGRGVPFDVVLPAAAEVEVLARVDTPERAVGRLAHHLRDISMLQIDPGVDYLRRPVAAFRAELRRERDRTAGQMIDSTSPRAWTLVCGRWSCLWWACGCEPSPRGVLGRGNIARY